MCLVTTTTVPIVPANSTNKPNKMPSQIRIPTEEDFASLSPDLTLALHFPSPPESTTAILIVFHGLGDSETNFANFAKSTNLPGVLAITVRGTYRLPPAMLGLDPDSGPHPHFQWGDDLSLSTQGGGLDTDPGFTKAFDQVMNRLVRETLLEKCGWQLSDILLFGYGQGGSVALGLASKAREQPRVEEVKDDDKEGQQASGTPGTSFKGVVSIGGALPSSMIPTLSARPKSKTPVLICYGRSCEDVDEDAVDVLKQEFDDVREVKWKKADSTMPSNREEFLPIMEFLAGSL